jgi:glutamate synthase domain-containing protein 1
MKIGFSLGRCVRDIVSGDVSIDDVAFIITATSIHSREQLDNVISVYCGEPNYLLGLNFEECLSVAQDLWDTNRLPQPRKQGLHRHMQPETSVWVDIFPTALSANDSVKKAWDAYRFMIHMVENVDTEATEVFKT